MATSIDDLLTTLDIESARPGRNDRRDATLALGRSALLLDRLREAHPETAETHTRDDVIRRLADACTQANIAFDGGAPGRLGDLVGVVGDAANRLGNGLSHQDTWAIAIRVATPARRFAKIVAVSGPYADVPQLLAVADRSRELLHAAAVAPPRLTDLSALDRPITSTLTDDRQALSADVVEATARLFEEFRRYGREPMTIRELVAVCHASSRLAAHIETSEHGSGTDESAAQAWQKARNAVAGYADGISTERGSFTTSRVILAALLVDQAVTRATHSAELAASGGTVPLDRTHLGRLLHQIASQCATELERIGPRLFVPRGASPLHEDRVGEWLRGKPFQVGPPDLVPAVTSLQTAGARSRVRGIAISQAPERLDLAAQL